MSAYASTLAGEAGAGLGDVARIAVEMAVSAGGENSALGSVYLGLASAALTVSLLHLPSTAACSWPTLRG